MPKNLCCDHLLVKDGVYTAVTGSVMSISLYRKANQIRAGERIVVPDKRYGFDWFRSVEPLGKGKLLVLEVPEAFAETYKTVERTWRTKGFAPEQAPKSYFVNLIDQIYGLIGPRNLSASDVAKEWDHAIIPYEIVR